MKRKIRFRSFVLALVLSLTLMAVGAVNSFGAQGDNTVYVRENATGDGTQSSPCGTFQEALNHIESGGTIKMLSDVSWNSTDDKSTVAAKEKAYFDKGSNFTFTIDGMGDGQNARKIYPYNGTTVSLGLCGGITLKSVKAESAIFADLSPLTIDGESVLGAVYGGSNGSALSGSSVITLRNGTVANIYGGCFGKKLSGSTEINILGGTVTGTVYGADEKSTTTGKACINVQDPATVYAINMRNASDNTNNRDVCFNHFTGTVSSLKYASTLYLNDSQCAVTSFGSSTEAIYHINFQSADSRLTVSGTSTIAGFLQGTGTVAFKDASASLTVKAIEGDAQIALSTDSVTERKLLTVSSGISGLNNLSLKLTGDTLDKNAVLSLSGKDVYITPLPQYNISKTITGQGTVSISPSDNCAAGKKVTLTATSNDGYYFDSVSVSDGTNQIALTNTAQNKYTFTMPAGAVTVTAEFKPVHYTVKFDKNAQDATGTMEDLSCIYGVSGNLTANGFARSGYNFKGWAESATGEAAYDAGQPIINLSKVHDSSITLFAVWEQKKDYQLSSTSMQQQKVTYNGGTQDYTVSWSAQAPSSYNVQYYQSGNLTGSPVSAGLYDVVITADGNGDYNSFRYETTLLIEKATPSFSLPTFSGSYTYDPGKTLGDFDLPSGWQWDNANTVPTVAVKSYPATFTPADTENYDYTAVTGWDSTSKTIKANISINIAKATPNFSLPTFGGSYTYDPSKKLSSFDLPGGWQWDNANTVPTVAVKSYPATFTPADTENYDYTAVTGWDAASKKVKVNISINIAKATPSFSLPTFSGSYTYDPSKPLSGFNLPSGWQWDNANTVPTVAVKSYPATFTPADTENYDYTAVTGWDAASKKVKVNILINIAKATPSFSLPAFSGSYTYDPSKKLSGFDLPSGWQWDNANTVPTVAVKSYPVTFTPADTENYDYTAIIGWDSTSKTVKANITINITKADVVLTIGCGDSTFGETVSPYVIENSGGGAVSYIYYSGDEKLDGAPTAEGSYKVKATAAATGNYNAGASDFVTFSIDPCSCSVSDITFDGADIKIKYSETGSVYQLESDFEITHCGNHTDGYTVAYQIIGDGHGASITQDNSLTVTDETAAGNVVTVRLTVTLDNGYQFTKDARFTVSKEASYTQRELTVEENPYVSGVTVKGDNIHKDAVLSVTALTDPDASAAFRVYDNDSQDLLIQCNISLLLNGGQGVPFSGTVTVSIPIDAKYNNQTLTVLHYKNGAVETLQGQVTNGCLIFTTDGFSPFAVVIPVEKIKDTESPGAGDPGSTNTGGSNTNTNGTDNAGKTPLASTAGNASPVTADRDYLIVFVIIAVNSLLVLYGTIRYNFVKFTEN